MRRASIGVVGALLDPERRAALDVENRAEQERLRALHAERERRSRCCRFAPRASAERRSSGTPTSSSRRRSSARGPSQPSLAELRRYVDWTFFFHAWELKGQVPGDPRATRRRAKRRGICSTRANELLDRIVADGASRPRGVHGFWPAAAEEDDIVLVDGTARCASRCCASRRRTATPDRTASLADFVAPAETGLDDHIGGVRGRRSTAPTRSPRRSRPRETTTARSWSRRSPTGSPRRSRSGSTSSRGARGTRPDEQLGERRARRASATGGSGRRSAIPRAPTTPRSRRCFDAARGGGGRARADRELRHRSPQRA